MEGSFRGRATCDDLFSVAYEVLKRIARRRLAAERPDHALGSSDLVHEVYLKLARLERIEWRGRAQFLAIAARAMRNILVSCALARKTAKRGGGRAAHPLPAELAVDAPPAGVVVAVRTALSRLEALDARQRRVVECRVFAGMSVEETADALGVSPASIKRDWALARAWLGRELAPWSAAA